VHSGGRSTPHIWFFGDFTFAFIEHWLFARGTYKLLWVLGISLEGKMISGAHVVIYSKDAEADRAFFRDVLGFKSVDAGHGWLIFGLPPGEAAFHPSDENGLHELYFICDGLKAEIASLAKKGVKCFEVQEARWGSITKMQLPSGGEVGLYQPKHPTALGLGLK
jgi:catechol 2,3-dioxygenase-like lactoylglutathione lyase family enzyme